MIFWLEVNRPQLIFWLEGIVLVARWRKSRRSLFNDNVARLKEIALATKMSQGLKDCAQDDDVAGL